MMWTKSRHKKWVVGNWKQHPLTPDDAHILTMQLQDAFTAAIDGLHVVVAPSTLHLMAVAKAFHDSGIDIAAQDVAHTNATIGAYTGDISAQQMRKAGAAFTLIGHSERRRHHKEDNAVLAQKINHAHAAGLGVILCVGESKADYDAARTLEVLASQLQVLALVDSDLCQDGLLLIAYEPVWAIGTGLVPSNDEIAAVHAYIRTSLQTRIPEVAVLYGGSVNETNAELLAACTEIDGVLVGGASLKAASFKAIAQAFAPAND